MPAYSPHVRTIFALAARPHLRPLELPTCSSAAAPPQPLTWKDWPSSASLQQIPALSTSRYVAREPRLLGARYRLCAISWFSSLIQALRLAGAAGPSSSCACLPPTVTSAPPAMRTSTILAAALGTASWAVAGDVLYSKRRLSKRFIDSDGNYNMSILKLAGRVRDALTNR